eukprot:gb/GECH01010063.1/.p1 GENE.gb/GECH01010063.1/~~gb/GECH01010063.1/.p1  ORF type:complete len:609 (+),score=123.55 gb/GECH01010063.1/:1-1827(+)
MFRSSLSPTSRLPRIPSHHLQYRYHDLSSMISFPSTRRTIQTQTCSRFNTIISFPFQMNCSCILNNSVKHNLQNRLFSSSRFWRRNNNEHKPFDRERNYNLWRDPFQKRSFTQNIVLQQNYNSNHQNRNLDHNYEKEDIWENEETIFAVSSGIGRSAVAVVRISGKHVNDVLRSITSATTKVTPRRALLRSIVHPESGETLDRALLLYFPGPRSFTGEDVLELHIHGGRAVMNDVLAALSSVPGLRPADAGEFTKRAYFNGKMDLTEVEGLGDLINAATHAQRKQALRQMEGELGRLVDGWRSELVHCMAHVTAFIDFGEDEDIDAAVYHELMPRVHHIVQQIKRQLSDGKRGERLRDGIHVAILGPPNAGKSSLLNILAHRDAAIVSDIAGTTRDVVEVSMDMEGFPLVVADTAGIRHTSDPIESEGVFRATQRATKADIRVVVLDSAEQYSTETLKEHWRHYESDVLSADTTLVVLNKQDQITPERQKEIEHSLLESTGENQLQFMWVSCHSKEGIDGLISTLSQLANNAVEGSNIGSEAVITRARHRHHLQECLDSLQAFVDHKDNADIAVEYLNQGANSLGEITGAIGLEEVLDKVFQDFCIGK